MKNGRSRGILLAFYLSMMETEQECQRVTEVYEGFKMACLRTAKKTIKNDHGLAEDAVHNAFLSLIEKKEYLNLPDRKLKILLLAIVKNRAIDLLRQESRNAAVYLDDMEPIPSTECPIEMQIITAEEYKELRVHIETLSEPYRSVIQLKYFIKLSNTEIGELLKLTNRQVETSHYYATQKLRKIYNYNLGNNGDEVICNG